MKKLDLDSPLCDEMGIFLSDSVLRAAQAADDVAKGKITKKQSSKEVAACLDIIQVIMIYGFLKKQKEAASEGITLQEFIKIETEETLEVINALLNSLVASK